MLEFLTTRATGVLVFAKGPISGDFMQIKLLGKTRARATMNLGMKCKITRKILMPCLESHKEPA